MIRATARKNNPRVDAPVNHVVAEFVDILTVPEDRRGSLRVSMTSFYADSIWIFREEVTPLEVRNHSVPFNSITMLDGSPLTDKANEHYLSHFKEFVYTLVASPPPTRPKLTTVIKFIGHGPVMFFRFMHHERIKHLGDVTVSDMERFLSWCSTLPNQNIPGKEISNLTLETRVSGLGWMFDQRKKMTNGLNVNPWDSISAQKWAAKEAGAERHGRTREMPDDIAQTLVLKAMLECRSVDGYFEAAKAYANRPARFMIPKFDWSQFGFQDHFHWSAYPSFATIAGYVLIAMFSGMRVDEIVALQLSYPGPYPGELLPCTFVEDVEVDGIVRKCHFVRGYTKKLEKEPRLTQWQVAPIVHEAIEVITRMRAHYRGEELYLFAARQKDSVTRRMYENSINDGLRKFVERHDIRWNGDLWHLATHQFRKKFARMLVRQGLGLRDIQDQLKHIDIEMTKRYGHVDLYHELQMERFALSNEQYDELLRGSTPIIGGGAAQIETLRMEFMGKTRERQDVFLESLTRNALIDAVDFGLCMYSPQRAQCGGNRQDCKPADCLNSVIPLDTAVRHLEGRRTRNEQLLRIVKSPLSRAHIVENQATTLRLLQQADAKGVTTTAELKALARK